MPQRRILVAKRPVNRTLALSALPSTSTSSAFVASSTRLNTHVLLGLSMLVLSANARPLDTSGGTGNTGFAGLLNGNAAEWGASGKGGIGGQLAESFLKMLHLTGGNVEQQSDDTLLDDIVRPGSPTAEYPAPMPDSTPTADSVTTWESPDIQEKTHMFESLLHQNSALSFVIGMTDLMHKMRELFVDIAIVEGEERGIFVGERTKPEIQNMGGDLVLDQAYAGEEAPSSALGLRLQSEQQRMPVYPSVSVEDDPPMFDLDDVNNNDGLIVPGQFTPTVKEPSQEPSRRPHEMIFENLNPSVNPYAALALSSVLATLFVVGVVVGRHYYFSTRGASGKSNVEDELERGESMATGQVDGSEGEKPAPAPPSVGSGDESAVKLDEKIAVEMEPIFAPTGTEAAVQSVGSNDASASELDEKTATELQSNTSPADLGASSEEVEAKEAMELLIDVANAALVSTTASVGANTAPTPKAVSSALDTIRSEVSRTPQTRHLHFVLPGSRPGTPSTPPMRPKSVLGGPAIVVAISEGANTSSSVVVENETFNLSPPGSPQSNASSFVSAYSHMPGGALSIGRAAGRKVERTALASAFVAQRALAIPQPSRVASPAPSLLGASGASPALSTMSYATAIEAPSTPAQRREQDFQALNATFHTRPTSPGYGPQPPGALNYFGDHSQYHGEGWPVDDSETMPAATGVSGGIQMRPAMLPPAQLTQTALELALMLPATEWIFQFIVVFIGWFGFWMRPVGTGPRGPSRG